MAHSMCHEWWFSLSTLMAYFNPIRSFVWNHCLIETDGLVKFWYFWLYCIKFPFFMEKMFWISIFLNYWIHLKTMLQKVTRQEELYKVLKFLISKNIDVLLQHPRLYYLICFKRILHVLLSVIKHTSFVIALLKFKKNGQECKTFLGRPHLVWLVLGWYSKSCKIRWLLTWDPVNRLQGRCSAKE